MAAFEFITRLRQRFTEFGSLTPIALVTTFLPIAGASVLLVVGYPLGSWLRENPGVGAVGFTFGVMIFCGLALVPTNVIGIIGGFAFGFYVGLLILIASVVAASFISFLIHGRIIGEKVPDLAEKHPKAGAVYRALVGQGFVRTTTIILLIRLSIIMPFALTNFILSSARVSAAAFITGTFLGMLPRSAAVVFAGAGLSELTLEAPSDICTISFGIAATLISIIVISIISRKALDTYTRSDG